MAEVFGIVAGAAGLAAAFEPCVTCFGYLQLARHFGKDFESCQIKLDVLRVRLSRWGLAVGLGENPNPNAPPITPQVTATAKELAVLEDVLNRLLEDLEEARQKSQKFKDRTKDSAALQVDDPATQLSERPHRIHILLSTVVSRRKPKRATFGQKVSWALYRKGDFENLIDDITTHMGELESVFPAAGTAILQNALVQTSKTEVSTLDDKADLKLLSEIAGTSDITLVEAVNQIMKTKGDTWRNVDIDTTKEAFNQLGSNYGAGEKRTGGNLYDGIKIRGSGTNHLGDNIGTTGSQSKK
jgi:hypothetical protein